MKTPQTAMLWELWRTSRLELLMRLGFISFMALAIGQITKVRGMQDAELDVIKGIVLPLMLMGSLFSSTWMGQFDNQQSGFQFRLGFVRPVTTFWLVVLPLAFAVVTAELCFVIPLLLFYAFGGVLLPIHAPVAILGTVVSSCLAAGWSPQTRVGKVLSLLGLFSGLLGFLWWCVASSNSEDPLIMAIGRGDFFAWTALHDVVCLAVITLNCWITVIAVDRQRHQIGTVREWTPQSLPTATDRPRGERDASVPSAVTANDPVGTRSFWFRTPWLAQCWYELRASGWPMLIGGLGCPLVFVLILCSAKSNSGHNHHPVVWIIALLASPVICQIIGAHFTTRLRYRQGTIDMSSFDAIRPFRSDQLVAIKFLTMAAGSAVSLLGLSLCAGMHYLLTSRKERWQEIASQVTGLLEHLTAVDSAMGISSFLLMLICGSSMLLVMAYWIPLYPGRLQALVWFGVLSFLAIFWDAHHQWRYANVWIACGYLLAATIVTLSVFAVRRAITSGSVSRWYLAAFGVLWLCSLLTGVSTFNRVTLPFTIPPVFIALTAAQSITPLAAAVLAPLAIGSHRHR